MINISFQGLSLFLPTVINSRKLFISDRYPYLIIWEQTQWVTSVCNWACFQQWLTKGACSSALGTVEAQLRTVPPYMVAAAWALFSAWTGYRMKQRCSPILISVLLQVVGYAIAVSTKNPHARSVSLFWWLWAWFTVSVSAMRHAFCRSPVVLLADPWYEFHRFDQIFSLNSSSSVSYMGHW